MLLLNLPEFEATQNISGDGPLRQDPVCLSYFSTIRDFLFYMFLRLAVASRERFENLRFLRAKLKIAPFETKNKNTPKLSIVLYLTYGR